MKTKFLIYSVLVFFNTYSIYAQDNSNPEKLQSHKEQYKVKDSLHFYFKLGGGYALPLAPATMYDFIPLDSRTDDGFLEVYETMYQNSPIGYIYQAKETKISLGKGINIQGALGVDISKHISAEIGAKYHLGSIITAFTNRIIYDSTVIASAGTENKELSSRMWAFDATIVLHEDLKKKLSSYLSLGAMLAMPTVKYAENISGETEGQPIYSTLQWKYYGGYAIGATASGGVSYKFNKAIEIFAEARITAFSYAPLKGKMTKYIVHGVNKVDTLPINETNVNFSNSFIWGDTSTISTSSPREQLKYHFPFSSWGINVGVKLNIGKTYYRKRKTVNKENN